MANILDKGIKKTFKDLKEEMVKDKMHKQNENMNKDQKNLKRNKDEILELKSTITKNSLERFKS